MLRAERFVTVTGPPGVGKSRLAAELAWRLPAPAVIVRLEGLTGPEQIAPAVAAALGATEPARFDDVERVRGRLLGRAAVLLLDNCEHLGDAVATFAGALLPDRPSVRILATSTRPLRAPGEAVFPLGPLPVADPDSSTADELIACDAVRLFEARAREVRRTFDLTSETVRTVARICRSVDGLPLAIELASARTSVLSERELLDRLIVQPALLSRGSGAAERWDGRHDSVDAAVAASHDLLDADERSLFARLSCFAAGFTLSAAEAVHTGPSTLDVLERLVDRSLVIADVRADGTRFRMLEPVRQFAARQLDAGDEPAVRRRHARYYAGLAGAAAAGRRGPDRAMWQRRMTEEQANVEAALEWATGDDDPGTALELAAHLWWRWIGTPRVGLAWYRRVLAAAQENPRTRDVDLLPALLSAAVVASLHWNAEAMFHAKQAAEVAEALGDVPGIVRALQHVSDIAYEQGDLDQARTTGTAALRLAQGQPDLYARARCQLTVAYNHLADLTLDDAVHWAAEARRTFHASDDEGGEADARLVIAEAMLLGGDPDDAESPLVQSLAAFARTGHDLHVARASTLLARVREHQGRHTDAAELVRGAFDRHLVIGHAWSIAHDLDLAAAMQVGRMQVGRRHGHHAAVLLGAAAGVRTEAGLMPMPRDEIGRADIEHRCRGLLGDAGLRAAIREGAALDLDGAIGLARAVA
jgi:predicted ATPase